MWCFFVALHMLVQPSPISLEPPSAKIKALPTFAFAFLSTVPPRYLSLGDAQPAQFGVSLCVCERVCLD